MKKKVMYFVCLCSVLTCALFLHTAIIKGEGDKLSTLLESFFYKGQLQVVVGNVESRIQSADCLIDSETCRVTNMEGAQECGVKTVLLVDSTMSLKKQQKEFLTNVFKNTLDQKGELDQFALIVMGDKTETLVKFTDDRYALMEEFENIEFEKNKANLGDGISKALDTLKMDHSKAIKRVIVFSDGDNAGDTSGILEEKIDSLSKDQYPIYTVGCGNKKQKEDMSENLYALSEASHVDTGNGYLLGEDAVDRVCEYIFDIYNSLVLRIKVPNKLLDGTEKPISIELKLDNKETIRIDKEKVYLIMAPNPKTTTPAPNLFMEDAGETDASFFTSDVALMVAAVVGVFVLLVAIACLVVYFFTRDSGRGRRGGPEQMVDYDVNVQGGKLLQENRSRMDPTARSFIQMEDEIEKTIMEMPPMQNNRQPNPRNMNGPQSGQFGFGGNMNGPQSGQFGFGGNASMQSNRIPNPSIQPQMMPNGYAGNANMADNFSGDSERTVSINFFQNVPEEETEKTVMIGAPQAMKQHTISLKDQAGNCVFLKEIVEEIVIGRSNASMNPNYIVIDYDSSVSKKHCRIIRQGDAYYIEDLGSLNHTYVQQKEVNGRVKIENKQVIGIGQLQFVFEIIE